MGKQDAAHAFLPPNGTLWTEEPFALPRGRLPPRKPRPNGNPRRGVEIIWRRIDARLDEALQERHAGGRTQLWILDRWYFEMDRDRRRLFSGTVDRRGELHEARKPFRLEYPLDIDLRTLRCPFFDQWPSQELVSVPHSNGHAKGHAIVMSAVHAMLEADPRYHSVGRVMRQALGLDAEVVRLAEAASPGLGTDSDDYERVWRNLAAFRETALDAPELLALLLAFVQGADDRFSGEPVRCVEDWFRSHGLGDAGWQRLLRAKEWASLWLGPERSARLRVLLRLAKRLEEAPPDTPLDSELVRGWMREILPIRPVESHAEEKPQPRFSAVVGSDNHIVVHKVAFAFVTRRGDLRFILEDGYGNVLSTGPTSAKGSLLRESRLRRVEDVRYVVAHHSGFHAPFPSRVLRSLRDMPAHYFGPGGVEASKLEPLIAMEERIDRAVAAETDD